MRCPRRFKEFATELDMQECDPECALLMERAGEDGSTVLACAEAVKAAEGPWRPVNAVEVRE